MSGLLPQCLPRAISEMDFTMMMPLRSSWSILHTGPGFPARLLPKVARRGHQARATMLSLGMGNTWAWIDQYLCSVDKFLEV
jgi:hypothetical protein